MRTRRQLTSQDSSLQDPRKLATEASLASISDSGAGAEAKLTKFADVNDSGEMMTISVLPPNLDQ